MMSENDSIEALLKSAIFRKLPLETLEGIAQAAVQRVVEEGEIIFREGDSADAFYIIHSGKVRIFVRQEQDLERELSVLGPGDSFGEVALLSGEKRTASASALQETRLLTLTQDTFERILAEYPEISRNFMKEMHNWLLRDQEIIKEEAEAVLESSRISWLHFLLIICLSVLLALSFNRTNPNGIPLFPSFSDREPGTMIGPAEAMEEYRKGNVLIVDAMPANFYGKEHIKGAVNMPMALFDIVYLMNFSEENKERTILVYGNTISRPYDLEIAEKLRLRGNKRVKILEGGIKAWRNKGYPVEGNAK